MKKICKRRSSFCFLYAALLVLFGVYFLFRPESSLIMLCFVIGLLLVLFGVWQLCVCFKRNTASLPAFLGIVAIAGGMVFAFRPAAVVSVLSVSAGLFVLVLGVLRLRDALQHCRTRRIRHPWLLCCAVICAGLGAVLIFCPFESSKTLMQVLGAVLIAAGIQEALNGACSPY